MASPRPRAALLGGIVRIKEALPLTLRHAWAVVLNHDHRLLFLPQAAHLHPSALTEHGHRVVQQVDHHPLYLWQVKGKRRNGLTGEAKLQIRMRLLVEGHQLGEHGPHLLYGLFDPWHPAKLENSPTSFLSSSA